MKKIGIMGGTFDPIHIGHLMLAQYAMSDKDLDEVWFIPTGFSYMKSARNVVSAYDRYEMTKLAVSDNDRMRCLDIETKRDGNTYSYETFEALKKLYPRYEFYFIFGADCLFQIEKWKEPERIFACVYGLMAVRDGAIHEMIMKKIDELAHKYNAKIELMDFPSIDISSTDIRKRVRENKSIRYFVPDKCIEYIKEKGFYRDEE